MTIELLMLLFTGGLYLLCATVSITYLLLKPNIFAISLVESYEAGGCSWVKSLEDATKDLRVALLIFLAFTILLLLSGISNDKTALGAQIFFGARLIHMLSYLCNAHTLKLGASFTSHMGLLILLTGFLQALSELVLNQ